MIEELHIESIRRHVEIYGEAYCLGDQKPGFGLPFRDINEVFRSLGYDRAVTIDYDGKADETLDLNHPLPSRLHERASVVFDGGTSEHVANVGQSLVNIVRLLRVGGLLEDVPGRT